MRYVVGIDEAGRGALAGPVVVGAVAVPKGLQLQKRYLPRLRDSKALSPLQREVWYKYIASAPEIYVASARIYQRKIDSLNIARSANLAASQALERILREMSFEEAPEVFLDGNLYLGHSDHRDLPTKTIIRGDQKRNPIKLASIVAKVTRDRYLSKLDDRYPEYGLGRHKGYGTKHHLKALKKHGFSEIHRTSFLKKLELKT